jgi:hypothetical protein
VISAVTIRNRSEETLNLERIKLPTEQLSIFASQAGFFWTQTLTMERDRDNQVSVQLGDAPPDAAGPTKLVASSRIPARGFMARAFQMFLG